MQTCAQQNKQNNVPIKPTQPADSMAFRNCSAWSTCNTNEHTHTHKNTRTPTHTQTHTQTRAQTHKHTDTYRHTYRHTWDEVSKVRGLNSSRSPKKQQKGGGVCVLHQISMGVLQHMAFCSKPLARAVMMMVRKKLQAHHFFRKAWHANKLKPKQNKKTKGWRPCSDCALRKATWGRGLILPRFICICWWEGFGGS